MFLTKGISNEHIKNYVNIWYKRNNIENIRNNGVVNDELNQIHTIHDAIYYNKYKFYFNISKDTENTVLVVITNKTNKLECATLRIDILRRYAELLGIIGDTTCAEPMLPILGKGKILLNCIIDFLKKNTYNIRVDYIELSDNGKKHCTGDKNFTMYMSDFYTLIEGVPWYYKIGFRHINVLANRDIEINKEIVNTLKVSNINIKKIIRKSIKNFKTNIEISELNSLLPNEKDIENYTFLYMKKKELYNYFKHQSDELVKNCIRELSKKDDGCKLVYCIHSELMKYMKLVSIKIKYMEDNYILRV